MEQPSQATATTTAITPLCCEIAFFSIPSIIVSVSVGLNVHCFIVGLGENIPILTFTGYVYWAITSPVIYFSEQSQQLQVYYSSSSKFHPLSAKPVGHVTKFPYSVVVVHDKCSTKNTYYGPD